jgi:hypothetical protein
VFVLGIVLVLDMALAPGVAAPTYAWSPDRVVTQAVIVVDISKSVDKPCEAAGKITQEILALPYALHSSVLVLATGDPSSSNEPRLLGRFPLPANSGVMEGAGRIRKEAHNLPQKVIAACTSAGQTDISPLFLAIKSGLLQLRNFECDKRVRCLLFVASDGEENAERNVRSALDGNVAGLKPLKGTLDNTSVEVAMCGISETVGQEKEKSGTIHVLTKKRNGEKSDRLHTVWADLFKDPAKLKIYSFCPPAGSLEASTNANVSQQPNNLR